MDVHAATLVVNFHVPAAVAWTHLLVFWSAFMLLVPPLVVPTPDPGPPSDRSVCAMPIFSISFDCMVFMPLAAPPEGIVQVVA